MCLSFSSSEDLILLKSTFVEMQDRRLRNFLYEYKPLTLRLSYGFASILSGAATPVSALTRHKILLLQCACASITSPSGFSSSDTALKRRHFTFCSKYWLLVLKRLTQETDESLHFLPIKPVSAFFNSAGFGVTLMLYTLASRSSTIHIHRTAVGCFNTNTVHGGILAI